MAIINVELRMMIAERLANDNYREEIKIENVRAQLKLNRNVEEKVQAKSAE